MTRILANKVSPAIDAGPTTRSKDRDAGFGTLLDGLGGGSADPDRSRSKEPSDGAASQVTSRGAGFRTPRPGTADHEDATAVVMALATAASAPAPAPAVPAFELQALRPAASGSGSDGWAADGAMPIRLAPAPGSSDESAPPPDEASPHGPSPEPLEAGGTGNGNSSARRPGRALPGASDPAAAAAMTGGTVSSTCPIVQAAVTPTARDGGMSANGDPGREQAVTSGNRSSSDPGVSGSLVRPSRSGLPLEPPAAAAMTASARSPALPPPFEDMTAPTNATSAGSAASENSRDRLTERSKAGGDAGSDTAVVSSWQAAMASAATVPPQRTAFTAISGGAPTQGPATGPLVPALASPVRSPETPGPADSRLAATATPAGTSPRDPVAAVPPSDPGAVAAATAPTAADQVVAALQTLGLGDGSSPAVVGTSPAPAVPTALAAPTSGPDAPVAKPGPVRTMTVRLNPDHLGPVSITLRMSGARVDVQIAVSSPEAHQLLERDRQVLTAAVEAAGGTGRDITVTSQTPSPSDATGSAPGGLSADNPFSGSASSDGSHSGAGRRSISDTPSTMANDEDTSPAPNPARTRVDGSLYV